MQDHGGDNTFLVNASLLKCALKTEEPVWIALKNDGQKEVSRTCPQWIFRPCDTNQINCPPAELTDLLKSLSSLLSNPPLFQELPVSEAATLVALAGFLLEYPAVYVPSPDLYLENVDLALWRVILSGASEHVLCRFSYPTHLMETVSRLLPHVLGPRIELMFRERLGAHACEWTDVRVEWTAIPSAQVWL